MEQRKITFSNSSLPVLLGIISLAIIVIISMVAGFGVIYYGTLFGIINIITLGLPIIGAIISYVGNKNLLSFELMFNLSILVLGLLVF